MADKLTVDTTAMRDAAAALKKIADEFSGSEVNALGLSRAVGNDHLAERIVDFAKSWDFRRAELTEQINTLSNNLTTGADGFDTTDSDLASELDGTDTP
jgi:uncharacterized protein YukE